MTDSTRSRVCARTRHGSLSTRDTVMWDTPARRATSAITGAGTSRRGALSSSVTAPSSPLCGPSGARAGRGGGDDVPDRDVVLLAGRVDDAVARPVGASLGVGGDDDPVRVEPGNGVPQRVQRTIVTEVAARVEPLRAEDLQRGVE